MPFCSGLPNRSDKNWIADTMESIPLFNWWLKDGNIRSIGNFSNAIWRSPLRVFAGNGFGKRLGTWWYCLSSSALNACFAVPILSQYWTSAPRPFCDLTQTSLPFNWSGTQIRLTECRWLRIHAEFEKDPWTFWMQRSLGHWAETKANGTHQQRAMRLITS